MHVYKWAVISLFVAAFAAVVTAWLFHLTAGWTLLVIALYFAVLFLATARKRPAKRNGEGGIHDQRR
jgi:hypothetical protein